MEFGKRPGLNRDTRPTGAELAKRAKVFDMTEAMPLVPFVSSQIPPEKQRGVLMQFEQKEMKWREFEKHCEELVKRCFPDDKYRICCGEKRIYADGVAKIMDISIAERKQGGRHYVVDCKHFPIAVLNENEIQTTLEYKRRSRAAKAIILVSGESNCPDGFMRSAESQGVPVIRVEVTNWILVNKVKEIFFKKEMWEALC